MCTMQEMSFEAFETLAKVHEKRKDFHEVWIGGNFAGYVSQPGKEGCREAHKMQVEFALRFNLPGASPAVHRPLPSWKALCDYPDLISRFPNSQVVMRQETSE